MMSRRDACESCHESIGNNDREHVLESAYGGMYASKVWHFRCLSIDEVIAGKFAFRSDQLTWYSIWHISRLIKENTVLKHKTEALADEVKRLLRDNDASGQEIDDFWAGFSFYDNRGG